MIKIYTATKIGLKEINLISSKIKISPERRDRITLKNIHFYSKYSRFIEKTLKRQTFQRFLCLVLELEGIDEKNIYSVKVGVYPAQRIRGFSIAGKCNPFTGKIFIYPKTIKFCKAFGKKYGKDILIMYAASRARAALIHELLHLKYVSDEEKVRTLTQAYFNEYMKRTLAKRSGSLSVYNLIFPQAENGCIASDNPQITMF